MMQVRPDIRHVTLCPMLGILATTDVTLDSLIGGLCDLYPDADDDSPFPTDPCNVNNNVHAAIVLARALQEIVNRICATQLQLVDPRGDYLF